MLNISPTAHHKQLSDCLPLDKTHSVPQFAAQEELKTLSCLVHRFSVKYTMEIYMKTTQHLMYATQVILQGLI